LSKLAATLAAFEQQMEDEVDEGDTGGPGVAGGGAPLGSTRKALQALYELYTVSAQKLPLLLEQVETCLHNATATSGEECPALLRETVCAPLGDAVAALQRSGELVTAVLDLDAARQEFLVQASYREGLHDLRNELPALEDELAACHQEMNDTWAEVSGTTTTVRLDAVDGREEWQFRLPNTNESKVLQQKIGQCGASAPCA